ncbi:2-dehydropantoate 2-reductase [Mangrovactinospora gilvigrisea]|uniref:2-dehydropantoate 2-reductase n=1 Tax=Mangrovactinospora gilvigrisea TaxID=1428644 RepID=A0A1J7C945_9ACTN|nr:2-dehydropantoate 2-reductase [Mangrovactinospora gilvigrisea]OIV38052.1 2-dehydropantoate 2-reductase [Mangrovactinospora gilvigrisea]
MRILVVGAGATGGFFGGKLALAGRDVTFLVRPARARLLQERGLRITGRGPEEALRPRLASPETLAGPYDLVMVTVKARALPQALDDAAPAVGPGTAVLPFLNGLAHLDTLNARFGEDAVLGGIVQVLATLDPVGDVRLLGDLGDLTLGEQRGGSSARVEKLVQHLDVPGFEVSASPDVLGAMWNKWVFISTLGALTTLMRGTVGDIAEAGGAWLGPALLAEAAAVAEAAGHPLSERRRSAVTAMVTQQGSTATASLYRDAAAGLPTEGEHILGDLTRRARALSVPTPLLDLAVLHLRVHEVRLDR